MYTCTQFDFDWWEDLLIDGNFMHGIVGGEIYYFFRTDIFSFLKENIFCPFTAFYLAVPCSCTLHVSLQWYSIAWLAHIFVSQNLWESLLRQNEQNFERLSFFAHTQIQHAQNSQHEKPFSKIPESWKCCDWFFTQFSAQFPPSIHSHFCDQKCPCSHGNISHALYFLFCEIEKI